jgi:hypothetical protein
MGVTSSSQPATVTDANIYIINHSTCNYPVQCIELSHVLLPGCFSVLCLMQHKVPHLLAVHLPIGHSLEPYDAYWVLSGVTCWVQSLASFHFHIFLLPSVLLVQ